MPTLFFVTGTSINVGKTVASRALLQAFTKQGKKALGYKPISVTSDSFPDSDAAILQSSSSAALALADINPVAIEHHKALTYSGSPIDAKTLSEGLEKVKRQADVVVVEGTSGWRFLLNNMTQLSQWLAENKMPVFLVVGIQAGCINHALLTAEAIINDGLYIAGWIANRINPGMAYYAETIDALKQTIPAPLIGEIPYLRRVNERDLSVYIDLSQLEIEY